MPCPANLIPFWSGPPALHWEIIQTFSEAAGPKYQRPVPTVSTVLKDGAILEMVYRKAERQTGLVLLRDGKLSRENALEVSPLYRLVPYLATNNLIKNDVVLFPSEPEEYG